MQIIEDPFYNSLLPICKVSVSIPILNCLSVFVIICFYATVHTKRISKERREFFFFRFFAVNFILGLSDKLQQEMSSLFGRKRVI